MMPSVDSGPIVAVCRFPMPERPERMTLSDFAYSKAVEVFAVVAAHCAECDDPMPPVPHEYWSGQKRTRAQFRALCDSLPNWSGEDAQRLKRACGRRGRWLRRTARIRNSWDYMAFERSAWGALGTPTRPEARSDRGVGAILVTKCGFGVLLLFQSETDIHEHKNREHDQG